MTNKNTKVNERTLGLRVYDYAKSKGLQGYKWLYDNPYSYLRVIIIAGLAGMWVFDYTKTHITMGNVQAISAIVAIIIVAHLLGGLKVFKR